MQMSADKVFQKKQPFVPLQQGKMNSDSIIPQLSQCF